MTYNNNKTDFFFNLLLFHSINNITFSVISKYLLKIYTLFGNSNQSHETFYWSWRMTFGENVQHYSYDQKQRFQLIVVLLG